MHSPELIVEARNGAAPLGYLVIDRSLNGACGGLRILPDVSLDEIKLLARAMTLKFGFAGIPMGGAKAGIIVPSECGTEERNERIRSFGRRIAPFLRTGGYFTGTDMGSSAADLSELFRGAGMPYDPRAGGGRTGCHTALTVAMCMRSAAQFKKLDLAGASVAIEGFGAVGSELAHLVSHRFEARLAAVATVRGALYNPSGLDIGKLEMLKERFGDELVFHYKDAEKISHEEFLALPVDVLSPCARHETIRADNADRIRASIVCGGANCSVSPEAERVLAGRGILSVPDFVASSGGVIGGRLEMDGWDVARIEEYIEKHYAPIISELIGQNKAGSLRFKAGRFALTRFKAMSERSDRGRKKGYRAKIARRLAEFGPMELRRRMRALSGTTAFDPSVGARGL